MTLSKIVITLKAALEGHTGKLNNRPFVNGVYTFVGSDLDCAGIARYYSTSFNCDVWRGLATEEPPQPVNEILMNNEPGFVEALAKKEAELEADGHLINPTAGPVEAPEPEAPVVTEEQPVDPPAEGEPTDREQAVIAAINQVEGHWVEDVVPFPSVAKVAELLGDSTVSKDEIVTAVEKFNLVDDSPDEQSHDENEASEE